MTLPETSTPRRTSLRRMLGAALLAWAAAGCDQPAPTAPTTPETVIARDIDVEDPTGTITVEPTSYLGERIHSVDGLYPLNTNRMQHWLVRLADGQNVRSIGATFSTPIDVTGLAAGDYELRLVSHDPTGGGWTTFARSPVITLEESGSATTSIALDEHVGVVGAVLRVNGEIAPDGQYRICPTVASSFGNCDGFSSNGTGAFRFWSVPGDGSFEVRTSTNVLLGTFAFTAVAGETTILESVDAEDPTGTITVEPTSYLGERIHSVDGLYPLNTNRMQHWLVRLADGQNVRSIGATLSTPIDVTGLAAGDYELRLVSHDPTGGGWTTFARSPVITLEESGSATTSIALDEHAGVVGAVLRVNGELAPDGQYRICPTVAWSFGNCDAFSSNGTGAFRFFSAPGDGSFEVRTSTNVLLGTFAFTAVAGETTILESVEVGDGSGKITVEPTSYLGERIHSVDGLYPLNTNRMQHWLVRLADGQNVRSIGATLSTPIDVTGLAAGDYELRLVSHDPTGGGWTTFARSPVITLEESGSATTSIALDEHAGVVGAVLRVNGELAPDGQYRICPTVAWSFGNCDAFSSNGTGAFRFFSAPGDGSFEVRTSTNVLLGTFTYRSAAGQTTIIGDLTGGTPGDTPVDKNVPVQPANDGENTTNTSISLNFAEVTSAGITTVSTSQTGPPPPDGFKLGNPPIYYELNTTAGFVGSITICINYTATTFPGGNLDNLVLQHGDGSGGWTPITTSHNQVDRIICGETPSLSPFIVMEAPDNRDPVADPGQNDATGYVGTEGSLVSFDASSSSDPDGDPLSFAWSFGDGGSGSGATPSHTYVDDGVFEATLTATDGNGGADVGTVPVHILNAPPEIGSMTVPTAPIALGTLASVSATFTDPGVADTHLGGVQWGSGAPFTAATVDGGSGSGSLSASRSDLPVGVHRVSFEVEDDDGGVATAMAPDYVVVYDPTGGFVTGGGWIDSPIGACTHAGCAADGSTTGKASFGFVAKYKRGANVPDGNTEFRFKAGDLDFLSTAYEWLVVAGTRAQFKGVGTIGGQGDYGFMITAVDGGSGNDATDAFRIKIVDRSTDEVVYDNMRGEDEDGTAATLLGGGSIIVHTR